MNSGLRATLHNPSDCSVLSHSLNSGHTATLCSAQIQQSWSSDTLGTLGERAYKKRGKKYGCVV